MKEEREETRRGDGRNKERMKGEKERDRPWER